MDKMRVITYERVSSTEQAEEGYSIEFQEEKLKAYCNFRDWVIVKNLRDPGYTGANLNRPGIKEVIKMVSEGEADLVLVYKLDRLSRSQKDTICLLEDVFLPNNCNFISINESFDTSTPFGRAVIGILSVFAQLERENIKERTVDGRVARAKAGLYSGNAHIIYGYNYVNGRLVVNPHEAIQVKKIFELYNKGMSMWRILNYMAEHYPAGNKWRNEMTIRRILFNVTYTGQLPYRGEIYQGVHEAIIDQKTFDRAQEVHAICSSNAYGQQKTPFKGRHLLSGLIYCGVCGNRMHAKNRGEKSYYTCYSVSKASKKYIQVDILDCDLDKFDCSFLDDMVWQELIGASLDPKNKDDKSRGDDGMYSIHQAELQKKIASCGKQIEKILDLYQYDDIDPSIVSSRLKKISEEQEALESELEILENSKQRISRKEFREKLDNCKYVMNNGSLEEQKQYLCTLVDKIIVYKDHIEVKWTF